MSDGGSISVNSPLRRTLGLIVFASSLMPSFLKCFIDMRLLMERFCVHFNEIYRPEHDDQFVEDNGRKIFLTYLRPIINGIGNYYCEAQTRDLTRTDIIINYLGQQVHTKNRQIGSKPMARVSTIYTCDVVNVFRYEFQSKVLPQSDCFEVIHLV